MDTEDGNRRQGEIAQTDSGPVEKHGRQHDRGHQIGPERRDLIAGDQHVAGRRDERAHRRDLLDRITLGKNRHETEQATQSDEKDAGRKCHVETGDRGDMRKSRDPKRLCRVLRHGAPLAGDDRGGEGSGVSGQDFADAIRNAVSERKQGRIKARSEPHGFPLPSRLQFRWPEKETNSADSGKVALESKVVETRQGRTGGGREPRSASQALPDRRWHMLAAGKEVHTFGRAPHSRLDRLQDPHSVAPFASCTLLPSLDDPAHGCDERLVKDDSRQPAGLPLGQQHADDCQTCAP